MYNGNSITREDLCFPTTRKSGTESAVDQANQVLERKRVGSGMTGRDEKTGFGGRTVKRMHLRRGKQGVRQRAENKRQNYRKV